MEIGPGLPISGGSPDYLSSSSKDVQKEIQAQRDACLEEIKECEARGDTKNAQLYRQFLDGFDGFEGLNSLLAKLEDKTYSPKEALSKRDQLQAGVGIQNYIDNRADWKLSDKQVEELEQLQQQILEGTITPEEAINKSTDIIMHPH